MTQTYFSKPLNDINKERSERDEFEYLVKQYRAIKVLRSQTKLRLYCLLCVSKLKGLTFTHRTIPFIKCKTCGHGQTKYLLPNNYPPKGTVDYDLIYPALNDKEYKDRVKRIYQPKFNWIVNSLVRHGLMYEQIQYKKWVELGCGDGSFGFCMKNEGFVNYYGIDENESMLKIAEKYINKQNLIFNQSTVAIRETDADIYIAFYLLEHIEKLNMFLNKLKDKPKGTIFIFAVPVFSFACLVENAFKDLSSRHIDCVIHTQIFTDESIDYMLNYTGYEKISEWVFGQDAVDLSRALIQKSNEDYPKEMLDECLTKLNSMQDELQQVFDKHRFADSCHIIAIKK